MFSFRFEFWVSIILDSLLLWQVLDTPEFTRNPDIEKKYFGETNWKKLLKNWAKQPTPSLVEGVSLEFSPAFPNFMTLLTILSCKAELSKGWSFFFFSVSKSGMEIEAIRLDILWKTIVFNKIVATETGHHLRFLSLHRPMVNIKCSPLVIQELPSVYSL